MAKSTFIFSAPEYLIVDTSEAGQDKGKYPPSNITKTGGNNSEVATPEPWISEIDWRGGGRSDGGDGGDGGNGGDGGDGGDGGSTGGSEGDIQKSN